MVIRDRGSLIAAFVCFGLGIGTTLLVQGCSKDKDSLKPEITAEQTATTAPSPSPTATPEKMCPCPREAVPKRQAKASRTLPPATKPEKEACAPKRILSMRELAERAEKKHKETYGRSRDET